MTIFSYIWKSTRGYRIKFLFLFSTVIMGTFSEALFPIAIAQIIDQIFYDKELDQFFLWFLVYASLYFFNQLMHGCLNYVWAKLKVTYLVDIRKVCFEHLLTLKAERLTNLKSGDVFKRIGDDVEAFLELIHKSLFYVLGNIFQLIISVGYLIYFDIYLGIVAIVTTFAMVLLIRYFGKLIRLKQERIQTEKGVLEAWIVEMINGIKEWKLLNAGKWVKDKYLKRTRDIFKLEISSGYIELFSNVTNNGTTLLGQLMIYIIAAYRIIANNMTIGQFVACMSYYTNCAKYFNAVAKKVSDISKNVVAANRVLDFLNWEEENDGIGAKERKIRKGRIQFCNVNFCYGSSFSVKNLIFSAEPGEKVSIVGESGGGKSTLLSLVYRLYDITGGTIYIDDQDIRKFTLKSLRSQIGIVQQNNSLIVGSVRKNIIISDQKEDDNKIWDLLRGLKLDEMVKKMPNGLDTIIGENGVVEEGETISGGQKQRIAIARVLYREPQILLLDEATSALDRKTENNVYEYILKKLPQATILSVSHRLSIVLKSDRVMIMKNGTLMEQGNVEELVNANLSFSKLY
jgi:ABC-type multidrug transport system fused ATPase/permease subunit